MEDFKQAKNNRQVAIWLLIGVGMIVIQVLIGGITRLTESGLSITEWKPLTGALPPLNHDAWILEFEKYKGTDQFKYVHPYFTLSEFKFIFFWEWFHRSWARLLGFVFLIGFIYFLITKKFNRGMIKPMIILFILGGLQGFIGWFMVKSGLVPEKYFVGHVELATHFIAAMGLLCYTLWFALSLWIKPGSIVIKPALHQFLLLILGVLILQLTYGAFMAGLHAAKTAPTWPDINGSLLPASAWDLSPASANLFNNPLMIHFIHRGLAYLLLLVVLIWWFKSAIKNGSILFYRLRLFFIIAIVFQAVLGILTLINATHPLRLTILGVSHQFVGMLFLMITVSLLFIIRKKQPVY